MDVTEFLNECQSRHSILQLDSFITIREGMTLYGCYHQALRELNSRDSALRGMVYQRAICAFKSFAWGLLPFGIFAKIATFHRDVCVAMDREIAEVHGEQNRIYDQARALRRAMEAQGISFPLSPEVREQLDREMWIAKLQAQAAVDLMVEGKIGKQIVEIVRALPRSMKEKLLPMFQIENQDRLKQWFFHYEPALPKLFGITECSESPDSSKLLPSTSPTAAPTSPENDLKLVS